MSVNEVVLDRDEFVAYLSERVDDITDVARALGFVESAFVLQNDAGRPAYLFSATEPIAEEDMKAIGAALTEVGSIGVFLPAKLVRKIRYDGTVTPDSIGLRRG